MIARLFICAALALATNVAPVARQEPTALGVPPPGETGERALAANARHEWHLVAGPSEFVEIAIEPMEMGEVDAWPTVTVLAPDQVVVYESDEPTISPSIDARARSIVSFVAQNAGQYRLRVAAPPSAIRYRLRLDTRRPAASEDAARIAARGVWREATRLARDGSPASLERAADTFATAAARLRAIGDEDGEATTLGAIANVRYRLSDAPRGTAAVDNALAIWRRLGREREEGIALSDRGLLAYLGYDYASARGYYDQALVKHRAVRDVQAEAATLTRVGWVHYAAAELHEAVDVTLRALARYQELGDRTGESVAFNDLGRAYHDLGDVSQALGAYARALRLRPPDRDAPGAANILVRIGHAYLSVGEWQQALDALERARDLARRARNVRAEIAAMINLGSSHVTLGNTAEAFRYLEPGLQLARSIRFRGVEASALLWMGIGATLDGELQRSRDYLEQAIAIQTAIGDVRGHATTLRQLAIVQLALGAPHEALDTVKSSLEISPSAGGLPYIGGVTLANVYAALGDADKAQAHYEETVARLRDVRARHAEAVALAQYARFQARRGRFVEARELLRPAIALHESLRGLLVDPDLRMSYTTAAIAPYELYTDVLMELDRSAPGSGFAQAAFDNTERARARGLLDMLVTSGLDIRQGVDRALVNREREIRWNLNAKAAVQTRLLAGQRDERRLAALEREIDALARELRDTANAIRKHSPNYASLTEPQPVTVKEIQKLLDRDTVLLEYADGEEQSWLFAVTDSSFESYPLGSRHAIETAARDMHRLLTARQPVGEEPPAARQRRIRLADAELRDRSRVLSDLIIRPIAAKLAAEWRGRRLAIVASGPLEYVPFSALPLREASGTWARALLLASNEVVTLPSASSLSLLRQHRTSRPRPRKTVAVFADPVFSADDPRVKRKAPAAPTASASDSEMPFLDAAGPGEARGALTRLPFSRAEAAAVVAQAPRPMVLQATDFDASLALATSERLQDYRILHFATHGFINTTRPELSGLVLSLVDPEGRSRDGFLRLNTIYNLRLSADLVVLSACQTALGKEVAGEGLIGLTRGFMFAGARGVIATLWQVNDAATAELMKQFYIGMLRRHLPAAAALRRAQLELASDERWSSPYFWAGFVLQGDWQP